MGIVCLSILAAAILSALQPRTYRAQAALEVQGVNENFLDLHNVYPSVAPVPDAAGYTQTQAEIYQQDAVLRELAKRLHLESLPAYQGGDLLEKLREDIRVAPSRNTRIVEIVCDARTPALAADLCNTMAKISVEQSVEARQSAARQTYESLGPHIAELRAAVKQSEAHGPSAVPDAAMYREFYTAMVRKASDAWMASRMRQPNVRLVGEATPPVRPHTPNIPLNLAVGAFGGILLAVGYVMFQSQDHSVLREPGEASLHLTVPELGAIPKAGYPRAFLQRRPVFNGNGRVELAALEQQSSRMSESFRTTLASILSTMRAGDHRRTLVVTSAGPMEGKTTVVSNLGIALAEISERVLLIDGDMRRPRLHTVFDEANSWGLSDVLREKNAIDELPVDVLVKKTSVPHIYLLPSGSCPENIFGLLCTGRMSKLLPRFREKFDYVLVDAPPCLEFADARIMAHCAGELLLVVRANHTHRRAAQAAVDRLKLDGVPVMGVILNRWDPTHSMVYGYPASRDGRREGVL